MVLVDAGTPDTAILREYTTDYEADAGYQSMLNAAMSHAKRSRFSLKSIRQGPGFELTAITLL
jgi:hypothetical protein